MAFIKTYRLLTLLLEAASSVGKYETDSLNAIFALEVECNICQSVPENGPVRTTDR